MDRDFVLGALRRYWWVVLALGLFGALLGAVPKPASTVDGLMRFQATHFLLVSSSSGSIYNDPVAINQVVLLATTGEVPKRAAEALGEASSAALAGQVAVTLDQSTGALSLTTTQDSAGRATEVADAFADELTTYIAERQDSLREARLAATLDRLESLETEIGDLQKEIARKPDDRVIAAQLDAKSRQYSVIFEQYDNLQSERSTLTLTTLQRAEALPVQDAGGLTTPKSRTTRGGLGFALGTTIGIAVALMLGRIDRRVRTRAQAEAIFGGAASVIIPVVDEAPDGIVVTGERHDQLSDAYRTVRSVVSFSQSMVAPMPALDDGSPAPHKGKVTLVVSACSGDGKTDLSINLAAAMVESGKRTVLVNTDFRRPSIHQRVLGKKAEPLAFMLEDLASMPAKFLLTSTDNPGMKVLDLSSMKSSPGDLARATARLLPGLQSMADALVIDTSPVGATAEVLELLPFADTIVMVMRLDYTIATQAARTMQILRSLTEATFILTIVGDSGATPYYYEYGNKSEPSRFAKRFQRAKK